MRRATRSIATASQKPCGYEAPELKAANHRLDGAFWPRCGDFGTPERPVVLLEVQMHAKPGFKHRLGAQSFRFLQLHPQVLHLAVVVLVRPKAELQASSQRILKRRPDLLSAVQTILLERLPLLTREELMEIATIPAKDLRHTRVAQEWIEEGRQEGLQEGRQEGLQEGEASVTLRQLNRRCGPLSDATAARIKALPLAQLEVLAVALLDFSGPADLAAWLAEHGG